MEDGNALCIAMMNNCGPSIAREVTDGRRACTWSHVCNGSCEEPPRRSIAKFGCNLPSETKEFSHIEDFNFIGYLEALNIRVHP